MIASLLTPAPPRRWRAALAVLALVLLAHVLVLAWLANDLSEWLVEDAPSQLAVVMLPAAEPIAPPAAPPVAPRARAARADQLTATVPAPSATEPAREPPAPAEPESRADSSESAANAAPEGELISADAPAPFTLALPREGRLVYHLTHSGYPGSTARTVVDWQVNALENVYEMNLRAVVGGVALLTSQSAGMVDAEGFQPARYTQRAATRAEVAVNFDWPAARVTYSASSAEHALAPGVQDPLSIQFQVPLLIQRAGARLAPGQTLRLQLARPSKLDTVEFIVRGEETVTTSAGQSVQALRLEAPRGPDSDRSWEFWLARDLHWLPVRIRLIDRRDNVWDNVLAALPGTPEPAPPDATQDPYHGS